jgi:hypothetical protein
MIADDDDRLTNMRTSSSSVALMKSLTSILALAVAALSCALPPKAIGESGGGSSGSSSPVARTGGIGVLSPTLADDEGAGGGVEPLSEGRWGELTDMPPKALLRAAFGVWGTPKKNRTQSVFY